MTCDGFGSLAPAKIGSQHDTLLRRPTAEMHVRSTVKVMVVQLHGRIPRQDDPSAIVEHTNVEDTTRDGPSVEVTEPTWNHGSPRYKKLLV